MRVRKQGVDLFILDNIGDIFGEMRLLDGLDRSASVYAEGKTVCLAVQTSATDRLEVEEEKANFLVTLYRMFSEFVTMRLRLTNEELVRVKKELDHLS